MSTEGVTDDVIRIDDESSGVPLSLSDIKDDSLTIEDRDADTDTLGDDDVEGELDNVARLVEDIDMSGDGEVDTDAEADCDGTESLLLEGMDRGEILGVEDIEVEPDNDASDEIEAEDEMLIDDNGLFDEVKEVAGVKLSDTLPVALLVGGKVGAPVDSTL